MTTRFKLTWNLPPELRYDEKKREVRQITQFAMDLFSVKPDQTAVYLKGSEVTVVLEKFDDEKSDRNEDRTKD